ncbi:copper resistance CopC family protein [Saccharothrix coeruleofusca]|uniref:CopC domain-containing protein n=1 Tax=Saccharothrix coeruleofusca TaxID=33919 RepID=A0A918AU78_9PSEU|nr:copper resistance CopC family protein [Saccharothrix coeruleofusca]GGP71630.1 hypothetical protein GCM10010185_50970 [Saccharothrix coeruleofusca]
MTRLALSALLACLAALGVATPAFAHTRLVSSDPADGSRAAQVPRQLTLTFSEPVPAESAQVQVTGPDNRAWGTTEVVARGTALVVSVDPGPAAAGQHRVSWRVESLDGDFVSGAIGFTLDAPAAQPGITTPTPPPTGTTGAAVPTETTGATTASGDSAATTTSSATGATTSSVPTSTVDDEGGSSVLLWTLVGLGALVAAAVVVALVRRKREDRPQGDTGSAE